MHESMLDPGWGDEERDMTGDTRPCLLCDKPLEPATPGDWDTLQPYAGGEMRLIFAFGSTQHDKYPGYTECRGLICDDCAAPLVDKMSVTGYGVDGRPVATPCPQGVDDRVVCVVVADRNGQFRAVTPDDEATSQRSDT